MEKYFKKHDCLTWIPQSDPGIAGYSMKNLTTMLCIRPQIHSSYSIKVNDLGRYSCLCMLIRDSDNLVVCANALRGKRRINFSHIMMRNFLLVYTIYYCST